MSSDAQYAGAVMRQQEDQPEGALLDQRVAQASAISMSARRCFARICRRDGCRRRLSTKKAEPTDHAKRLVAAIHAVLNQAIKAALIAPGPPPDVGELGYFQHSFKFTIAKARNARRGLRRIVRRFAQNGRSPSGVRSARSDFKHVASSGAGLHDACYRRGKLVGRPNAVENLVVRS